MSDKTSSSKKMVSFRIDEETFDLIEQVRALKGTMYWERGKSYLFDLALREYYGPIIARYERMTEAQGAD